MIRAVVFDVGECLVDETREYGTWADWLGVPRHTFAALFGAVIAQGRDYREAFQVFRPGFDLYAASTCTRSGSGARTPPGGRRRNADRTRPPRPPWATIQWDSPEARELPTFRVESLAELPGLIADFNARAR
ncbi:hypothetical protein [Streptomyces lichenis]|uniref:Haloacid dehalogenase n=1 Tax=Streptomyces lichenis TaxID=2306967 RepID=A0ABT0I973_9ACTN|nr:hypothetical protein [Streptomyces lichenis]MCK8677885.1 hypothetical protein [Streptomyces lichenis]